MAKLLLLIVLVALMSVPALAQAPAAQSPSVQAPATQAVLADGTPVKLRAGAAADAGSVRVGDIVELEVAEDVRVADLVVLPASSVAIAVVTAEHALHASTRNQIEVNLRSVTLPDGEKVSLRNTKAPVPQVAIITNSQGQDLAISNGAEVTAYVNGNVPLDLTKLHVASGPSAELQVNSTPGNAEVSIDGRVVGNTPYSAHVPKGDHVVVVRMAGYLPWRQNVHLATETANLQVSLAKQDGTESSSPQAAAPTMSLGELARAARAKRAAQDAQRPQSSAGDAHVQETKAAAAPQN